MELKIYMLILLRKWWIVLSVFVITLTATIVFTFMQPPIYEATVTFVIVPNPSLAGSVVYGVDILSRQTEIGNTYAEIALSRLVRGRVADKLGLSMSQMAYFSIDAYPLSGTNLLKITVQGRNRESVSLLANTIGDETVAYVKDLQELQGIYNLNLLDSAPEEGYQVARNEKMQVALGAVFGLALGCGLAFFLEYLQIPLRSPTEFNILDEESGVYNRTFLKQRLEEEMARAERNAYALSLACIDIDRAREIEALSSPQEQSAVIRRAAMFLMRHIRTEDVIARTKGTVFAILLPDLRKEEAESFIEELQMGITSMSFKLERGGGALDLNCRAAVATYQRNQLSPEEFLAQAEKSLQRSESVSGAISSSTAEILAV
ncbi:MAG: diguanylate cyclase domain-containing protein [Anaerolineales bacterium]